MNIIYAVAISNVVALGIASLFFYKLWLPWLRPDWFYIFRIFEHNLLNYREEKIFTLTKGKKDEYMFTGELYNKKGVNPYISPEGVYTWNFIQGHSFPIVFEIEKGPETAKLLAEAKKTTLDNIWLNDDPFQNFIKNYGIIILAICILALIGYLVTKDQQTTRILMNLTRR